MAFIPVPDTALASLICNVANKSLVNTLWFELSGGWDSSSLLDLATKLADWWWTNVANLCSNAVTLQEITARDMSEESGPIMSFFPSAANVGSRGSPVLPGNVTWAIQFKTGLAGRSFRGRNYVIGLAEDQATGDAVASTTAAAYIVAYAALNAEINEEIPAVHVVASRYNNGAPREVGVTTAVTTYGFADLWLDSQRRRLQGRGT